MKIKAKSIEECTTLFEIDVPKETISKALEEVYVEMMKVANIPGFRQGKAPLELVKKHYLKDAKEEVLKRLIPDAYRNALEEHKIEAIGYPEITDVSFEEDKILSFKAKVDTKPKFKLKDYKAIKVVRKKAQIKDDDIDKTIENLRGLNAKYVSIEDRPVQMGDYVVSDMECLVDGKPIHKKRENLWLYLEKESLVPELSEKMVGMKKGETKEIDITLPEKYPDKNVASKPARYIVFAKEIKRRELPAIDDEFAKDLGKDKLSDLKDEIRKELEARSKVNVEVDMENQLLNKLMDENVFAVPSKLVEKQLAFMVDDAKRRLEANGFARQELDKKDNEFREKFKDDAVRQVRLLFIMDEIASFEKIKVDENDLNNAYHSISAQSGKTEEAVKEYYKKEDLVDGLEDKVREAKTIQFLLKSANVVEA